MFKLIKYRQPGEYPPRGYRPAYSEWERDRDVCYPIGIHWIAMLLRWLYHASYYVRLDELDTLRVKCRALNSYNQDICEELWLLRRETEQLVQLYSESRKQYYWFLDRNRRYALRYGQHRKLVERVKLFCRWWPTDQLIEHAKCSDEHGEFAKELLGIAQDCGFFGEGNQFDRPCYRKSTRVTVDRIGAGDTFEWRCVTEETPDVVFVVIRAGEPYKPGRMTVCLTREEAERQYDKASIYPVSAKGVLAKLICNS